MFKCNWRLVNCLNAIGEEAGSVVTNSVDRFTDEFIIDLLCSRESPTVYFQLKEEVDFFFDRIQQFYELLVQKNIKDFPSKIINCFSSENFVFISVRPQILEDGENYFCRIQLARKFIIIRSCIKEIFDKRKLSLNV